MSINQLQDQSCGRFLRYPLYPWQDTDLWAEDEYKVPAKTMHLIGLPTYVNKQRMIWENEIDLHRFGFLNDHVMKSSGNHDMHHSHNVSLICNRKLVYEYAHVL